jgi:DNA polymerase-3 subunit beta
MDVAAKITAETIRFEFQDSGSPTLVKDPKDEHSLYVLMPMRV